MRHRFGGVAVVTALAALFDASALSDEELPFVRLFDGQTLEGWTREHTESYLVRDGVIVSEGGTGWLRYNTPFRDFELKAEYRTLKKDAASGLIFRASSESTPKDPHRPMRGYQLQMMEARNHFAMLGFGVAPPRFNRKSDILKEVMKGSGQWQTITLRVVGSHAEAALNGKTITVSDSIEIRAGCIGLRSENRHVEWRNLKIKELPMP